LEIIILNILAIVVPLLALSFPFAFAESSNIGSMYWKQEIISPNSFVDIYVHDDDMNKKEYPNFADKFTIYVWSDSSPSGLEIPVVETGVYSGIFKGRVFIADSGDTAKNRLVSMPGDTVYAKYVDFTMPDGSTSDIFSAAIVKISGQNMNPLLDEIDPNFRMSKSAETVPAWVKNNAGWWAEGQITESDFLSGINHLVKNGIISVSQNSIESVSDSIVSECESIKSNYKRLNCEKEIKQNLESAEFKKSSDAYPVGSITYYYPGIGNFGNEFEISSSGQAMLRLRILAENNGSEVVSLKCTGPSICNYDVWDGSKSFKYAGMDFVSGQIPINPGTSIIFNMMFGPNIGYGGNQFLYDPSKNYDFRVDESFGNVEIPLKIE
jgi:hypothetical protein